MKLVKYIYIGCLSLMTLSSCSDYLDKESDTEATLELVFNDKDKLEGWLAGVQSGTPDPIWVMADLSVGTFLEMR